MYLSNSNIYFVQNGGGKLFQLKENKIVTVTDKPVSKNKTASLVIEDAEPVLKSPVFTNTQKTEEPQKPLTKFGSLEKIRQQVALKNHHKHAGKI